MIKDKFLYDEWSIAKMNGKSKKAGNPTSFVIVTPACHPCMSSQRVIPACHPGLVPGSPYTVPSAEHFLTFL